jgi:hypothetical protein
MLRKALSILVGLLLVLAPGSAPLLAQSDNPKFELGGHYSLLTSGYRDSGLGGRFGVNLHPYLTAEAEFSDYFQDRYYEGTKRMGLFGVSIGPRTETISLFTKISPGFIHFSNEYNPSCSGISFICTTPQTHFALDMGGGFELYPNHHTYIRFDIGNLWIHRSSASSNELLMTVGAGFRF